MFQPKITIQRGFNDLFFRFLEDLIVMFPNDNQFLIAKTTFELMKRNNPGSLIKGWYTFITSYFVARNEVYNLEKLIELYTQLVPENKIVEITNFLEKLVVEINKIKNSSAVEDINKYKTIDAFFFNLNKLAHTHASS